MLERQANTANPSGLIAKVRDFFGLERNILVLCTTGILLNLGRNVYGPFLPLYFQSLDVSFALLGGIFSILAIASAFITVPGGHFADRFGRKNITVLGSAMLAVSILLLYWIGWWPLAVGCLIVASFGVDIYRPATYAMIVESVPADRRATAFSTMGLIAFSGALIAPILGGYLSLGGDYRILFLVGSVFLFLMTLFRQLFLRETKARKKPSTDAEKSEEAKELSFAEKLRMTWNSGISTRAYLIFGVASALGGTMANPYFAAFYNQILMLDQLQLGLLTTASLITTMIFQLPGGKVADKIGRKPLFLLSIISSPLTLFAITQATDFIQLVAIQLVSGVIGGISMGASITLPTELVSEEYRATALGVFNTTSQLAGAIGPSIGGLFILYYPFFTFPRHIFYVTILAQIPSIILFAAFVKETLKTKPKSD
ncbi:MAG: MFS transporter [Candidatus Bathyarchaeota archaeon]|jgi:MFS family permease